MGLCIGFRSGLMNFQRILTRESGRALEYKYQFFCTLAGEDMGHYTDIGVIFLTGKVRMTFGWLTV